MQTLSLIVPFFAVIGIGYLAARTRLLPMVSVGGLNTFVLFFALPAMLFQFAAGTPVGEVLNPILLGLWFLAGLLVMAGAIVTGLRQGRGWLDAAFGGLVAVTPNSGFMGLPLIIALRGEGASAPLVATLLVDIVIMQSVALALTQQGQRGPVGEKVRTTVKRVASNPLPWAIVLGALWGATGWSLFGPLDAVLTMLASASTPVALFTIGAVLARTAAPATHAGSRTRTSSHAPAERTTEPDGNVAGPDEMSAGPDGAATSRTKDTLDIGWLTALKLLIHPALVWGLGSLAMAAGLPLHPGALIVLILAAALPAAANAAMLAERLGAQSGRIAAVILVSTVLGFGTFTAVALLV